MTLNLHSCDHDPKSGPTRMDRADFMACLLRLGYGSDYERATDRFAAYTGANERTVRRWTSGDSDIPNWVPVLLRLQERLTEALAWSEQHGDLTAQEITWRFEAEQTLWPST